jgi:multidrug efflux pump subunit AcrB
MYDWLLRNHILTNLTFLLVIAAGVVSFITLPRQQDPSVNFNWVEIHTRFPGASAADVEERVTDVLETGVEQVRDIRFSRSESRAGFSRIIVRFRDLDEDDFDDHVTDLRREIQNRSGQLPNGAEASEFLQINREVGLCVRQPWIVECVCACRCLCCSQTDCSHHAPSNAACDNWFVLSVLNPKPS